MPILPGSKIDRSYLTHFLRQPRLIDFAASRSEGANLPRLSPKALAEFEIPLPPLDEQKRIAAILDQADALRRLRQRAIDRLNELGQAIFYEMFGDPATNPRKWPIRRFEELARNEDGRRIPIKMADRERLSGDFPYYGASGIIDYVNDFIYEGPHLLISEDGANLIARSTPVAFMANGRFWVNNHAHVFAQNQHADLRFLEAFIEAIDLKRYVSGSAQPKLTQASLNAIEVPTPPLELQGRFAFLLAGAETTLGLAAGYQKSTECLFEALQQRAFQGSL